MKVVILGAGTVGYQLAKYLIDINSDVVLIEKDPEKARHASETLDCLVINEEGNNLDTLAKAGTASADFFISVTDSDEVNMISCSIVSSEFNVPWKIARVRNISYADTRVLKKSAFGIDFFVNPEIETVRSIMQSIDDGAVSDLVTFQKSNLQMRSIVATGDYHMVDHSIEEIKREMSVNFLIAVIFRENTYIIPNGDTIIHENDKLYLVATEEDFETLFTQLGKENTSLRKIVLIGGNNVSLLLAERLLEKPQDKALTLFWKLLKNFSPPKARNINILDNNIDNCRIISERFPDAMVFNTDISDDSFNEDEQLADADLVIAATGNQELNIVNAVYAKNVGARRTIALVNKSKYVHIASSLGIDVAFSPTDSMVTSVLQYMRRDTMHAVYSISGGEVEVLEMLVEETSKVAGHRIRDLKLPKSTLVLSVTRGEQNIIPGGNLVLEQGDYVIIIVYKKSAPQIEKLFTS